MDPNGKPLITSLLEEAIFNAATFNTAATTAPNLTLDTLKKALATVRTVRPIVGLACNVLVYCRVAQEFQPPADNNTLGSSIPILVDPRLPNDGTQVFYDREEWRTRCEEQRAWDRAQQPRGQYIKIPGLPQ